MAVRVGSARSNENGRISGGKPGDQKGGAEVNTQNWYLHSKGWIVIRAKDDTVRENIAWNMEAACKNDNIGYCQNHRTSATAAAQPYGYDLSKVAVPVEVDCSELVRICCLYAGIQVGTFSTSSEVAALQGTGKFTVLRDSAHCASPDQLLRGDIMVTRTKGHTVVVLDNGPKVNVSGTTTAPKPDNVDAARSRDNAISGTYRTTANLNLRAGAGTSKKSIVVIPKGTSVQCYGYYTLHQGTRWYYVTVIVSGKKYTGFCSCKYLNFIKTRTI